MFQGDQVLGVSLIMGAFGEECVVNERVRWTNNIQDLLFTKFKVHVKRVGKVKI